MVGLKGPKKPFYRFFAFPPPCLPTVFSQYLLTRVQWSSEIFTIATKRDDEHTRVICLGLRIGPASVDFLTRVMIPVRKGSMFVLDDFSISAMNFSETFFPKTIVLVLVADVIRSLGSRLFVLRLFSAKK